MDGHGNDQEWWIEPESHVSGEDWVRWECELADVWEVWRVGFNRLDREGMR